MDSNVPLLVELPDYITSRTTRWKAILPEEAVTTQCTAAEDGGMEVEFPSETLEKYRGEAFSVGQPLAMEFEDGGSIVSASVIILDVFSRDGNTIVLTCPTDDVERIQRRDSYRCRLFASCMVIPTSDHEQMHSGLIRDVSESGVGMWVNCPPNILTAGESAYVMLDIKELEGLRTAVEFMWVRHKPVLEIFDAHEISDPDLESGAFIGATFISMEATTKERIRDFVWQSQIKARRRSH